MKRSSVLSIRRISSEVQDTEFLQLKLTCLQIQYESHLAGPLRFGLKFECPREPLRVAMPACCRWTTAAQNKLCSSFRSVRKGVVSAASFGRAIKLG